MPAAGLRLLFFVLVLSSATGVAMAAPRAAPAGCDYLSLKLGPAVELSGGDKISIDQTRELLKIEADDSSTVYDLKRGGTVEVKEAKRGAGASKLVTSGKSAGPAPASQDLGGTFAQSIPTAETTMRLANGRSLTISRLYANNYLIRIGDKDDARYDTFGRDLLAGTYCGRPIKSLPVALKRQLKPLVTYFLFSEIASGKIEDFRSWVKYSPVFTTLLNIKEIEAFLDIYGYRTSERGRDAPLFARMDPNVLWTFAWNAVAKIFHDKDASDFTDLVIYQRQGKIYFNVVGSQPIAGGEGNKYGFYTKAVEELDVHSVKEAKALHWEWRQGHIQYSGVADLHPTLPAPAKLDRFAGRARNGLIVLDATMMILDPSETTADVKEALRSYTGYFKALGYRFGPRIRLADAPAFIDATVSRGDLDFFIKDGHADSDPENLMVAFSNGYVLSGRRSENGREDKIDIVFTFAKKPKQRRIAYADFAQILERRFAKAGTPLVLIDGSCWGIEKAWFGLSAAHSSQLLQISANTPVNFFENDRRSAMRVILDGALKGTTFADLRARLSEISGYKSGREDHFVFPDEPLYPLSGPLVRIDRRLFFRTAGKPQKRYTPGGYL